MEGHMARATERLERTLAEHETFESAASQAASPDGTAPVA